MIADSSDRHVADGCLELDKRVSLVVRIRRAGLAAGTEIGVVANSALVAVTLDVSLDTIALVAEWSITVDTVVTRLAAIRSRQ
jgi:hypothetical protein